MIENISIAQTSKMPEIMANAENGEISISGSAIDKNCIEYFQPLNDWLATYYKEPQELTRLNIRMKYFSKSAFFEVRDIISQLNDAFLQRNKSVIYWYCSLSDEKMYLLGEDFKDDVTVPFHIVVED